MYTVDDHIKKASPTVKSVLMERWAKDTDNMATDIIWLYYDAIRNAFILPNGKVVWLVDTAIKECAAYLNSAVHMERSDSRAATNQVDRCTVCDNNGKPICSSCIMTGHGNDIDFYRVATEPKGEHHD